MSRKSPATIFVQTGDEPPTEVPWSVAHDKIVNDWDSRVPQNPGKLTRVEFSNRSKLRPETLDTT